MFGFAFESGIVAAQHRTRKQLRPSSLRETTEQHIRSKPMDAHSVMPPRSLLEEASSDPPVRALHAMGRKRSKVSEVSGFVVT